MYRCQQKGNRSKKKLFGKVDLRKSKFYHSARRSDTTVLSPILTYGTCNSLIRSVSQKYNRKVGKYRMTSDIGRGSLLVDVFILTG